MHHLSSVSAVENSLLRKLQCRADPDSISGKSLWALSAAHLWGSQRVTLCRVRHVWPSFRGFDRPTSIPIARDALNYYGRVALQKELFPTPV